MIGGPNGLILLDIDDLLRLLVGEGPIEGDDRHTELATSRHDQRVVETGSPTLKERTASAVSE